MKSKVGGEILGESESSEGKERDGKPLAGGYNS